MPAKTSVSLYYPVVSLVFNDMPVGTGNTTSCHKSGKRVQGMRLSRYPMRGYLSIIFLQDEEARVRSRHFQFWSAPAVGFYVNEGNRYISFRQSRVYFFDSLIALIVVFLRNKIAIPYYRTPYEWSDSEKLTRKRQEKERKKTGKLKLLKNDQPFMYRII